MDAFGGHQIDIRVMQRRHGGVNSGDNLLVLMRARHRQHAGMGLPNARLFNTETAGDDDAAVLGHGFANCVEAFFFCGIEKAAGVDDDDIGT